MTRRGYVHEVDLEFAPGADRRAPGGEVTRELRGHWEHEGACRWPHLSLVEGDRPARLRVLIVAEPETIEEIRTRINNALLGQAGWKVAVTLPERELTPSEAEWASRQNR